MLLDYVNKKIDELTAQVQELETKIAHFKGGQAEGNGLSQLQKKIESHLQQLEGRIQEVAQQPKGSKFALFSRGGGGGGNAAGLEEQIKEVHFKVDTAVSRLENVLRTKVMEIDKKIQDVSGRAAAAPKGEDAPGGADRAALEAKLKEIQKTTEEMVVKFQAGVKSKLDAWEKKLESVKAGAGAPAGGTAPAVGKIESRVDELETLLKKIEAAPAPKRGPTPLVLPAELKSKVERLEAQMTELITKVDRASGSGGSAPAGAKGKNTDLEKKLAEMDDRFSKFSATMEKMVKDRMSPAKDSKAIPASTELGIKLKELENRVERVDRQSSEIETALHKEIDEKLKALDARFKEAASQAKPDASGDIGEIQARVDEMTRKLDALDHASAKIETSLSGEIEKHIKELEKRISALGTEAKGTVVESSEQLHAMVQELGKKVRALDERTSDVAKEISDELDKRMERFEMQISEARSQSEDEFRQGADTLEKKISELSLRLNGIEQSVPQDGGRDAAERAGMLEEKLNEFSNHLSHLEEKIGTASQGNDAALQQWSGRLDEMESDLTALKEKMAGAPAEEVEKRIEALRLEARREVEEVRDDVENRFKEMDTRSWKLTEFMGGEFETRLNKIENRLRELKAPSGRGGARAADAPVSPEILAKITQLESDLRRVAVPPSPPVDLLGSQLEQRIKLVEARCEQLRARPAGVDLETFETLSARLEAVESRVRKAERVPVAAEAVDAELETKITRLESRLETLRSESREITAEVTDRLTARLERFDLRLKEVEQAAGKWAASSLEGMDRRLGRIEAQGEEVRQQVKSAADEAGREAAAKLEKLELRLRQVDDRAEKLASGFMQDFEVRIGRFDARVDELQNEIHLASSESKALLARVDRFEGRFKQIEDQAAKITDSLGTDLAAQLKRMEDRLAEHHQEAKHDLSASEKEVSLRFQHYEGRLEELDKRAGKLTDSFGEEIGSRIGRLEVRFRELRAEAKGATEQMNTEFGAKLESFEQKLREVAAELGQVHDSVSTEMLEKMMQEKIWKNIQEKMDASFTGVQGKSEQQIQHAEKSLWVRLMARFSLVAILVALVFVGAVLIAYPVMVGRAREAVRPEIESQFAQSSVRDTMIEVAESQVPQIIRDEVDPLLESIRQTAADQSIAFRGYLDETEKKYGDAYQDFGREIEFLRRYNEISRLEADAVNLGDRSAWNKLQQTLTGSAPAQIQDAARAGLARIVSFYESADRVKGFRIGHRGTSGFEYDDYMVPTEILVNYLREDPDWRVRTRAAQMLAGRKEPGVPDVLLESAERDTRLDTAHAALKGFESVTGFESPQAFGAEFARKWWREHGRDVNRELRLEADRPAG